MTKYTIWAKTIKLSQNYGFEDVQAEGDNSASAKHEDKSSASLLSLSHSFARAFIEERYNEQ